tara:strand:+ start:2800 stop:3462 length:663 start_codon:yes stop_codon:yes gene_type:complete
MNIILHIECFNTDNIYYKESVRNNIISNSNFIKTIYSNNILTLNIIYIKLPIKIISYEKQYNKYKCIIDLNSNKIGINKLFSIEKEIINKININKTKVYDLYKQITSKNINLFINKKHNNENNENNINNENYINNKNNKNNENNENNINNINNENNENNINNKNNINNENNRLNKKLNNENNNEIKYINDNVNITNYINIKISGVWESENNCGLTFKFVI